MQTEINAPTADNFFAYYLKLMTALETPKERMKLFNQIINATCPECGCTQFSLDKERGELTCTNCGLVKERGIESRFTVDFQQSRNCSPTAAISFGKSHGGTIDDNALFKVLAGQTTEDLGLRARFMRIFTNTLEHPVVKLMLTLGSKRVREARWQINDQEKKSICFAEDFAKKLRYIGAFIAFGNFHPRLRKIVDATFVLCLEQYGEIRLMNDAFEALEIDQNVFEGVNLFFALPRCFGK